MRSVRTFAFTGFLLVILLPAGCGGGGKEPPRATSPQPEIKMNAPIPEERQNSKGGFEKTFPKGVRGR